MNKGLLGRIALFTTALIWGTSFVIMKSTLDSIGTMWLLTIRFGVAALLFSLLSVRRFKTMDCAAFKGSFLIGICLAVAYVFQTYGLVFTSPGKNAFITATYCVMTPFFAWGIYKRYPGMSSFVAAFLCVAGIGFVSLDGIGNGVNLGDALTLVCGVFYALHIIMVEHYVSGEGDALCITAVQFASAALFCLVGALIFEPVPKALPASAWFSLMYLAVMCTGVCFFLQVWGLKYTPSATGAMIMTLESVFGTLISVLFYHERLSFKLVCGFALIFAAVLISELKPDFLNGRKKKAASVE